MNQKKELNMKVSRIYYSDKETAYLKNVCSNSTNYRRAAVIASNKLERTTQAIYMKLRTEKYPLKKKEKKINVVSGEKSFVITITISEK